MQFSNLAKIYACWVTGLTWCMHIWWTYACMNTFPQELEIKAAPLTTASYPVQKQWYSTPMWSFLHSTEGYKASCDYVRFSAGRHMLQGDKLPASAISWTYIPCHRILITKIWRLMGNLLKLTKSLLFYISGTRTRHWQCNFFGKKSLLWYSFRILL